MKQNNKRLLAVSIVTLALSACSMTPDKVVFVTKTSLSVLEVDDTPPSINVAYDRVEGIYGPSYEGGEVPSVIASINSDGSIFNPEVKQVYATGNAAKILTNQDKEETILSGKKRLMFFGTSTNSGLKVGFSPESGLPVSFNFGYKRKELSVIPLGKTDESKEIYPSVIAVVHTNAEGETKNAVSLGNTQYFATGIAAEGLASNEYIKSYLQFELESSIVPVKDIYDQQRNMAAKVLVVYSKIIDKHKIEVWKQANALGLLLPPEEDETPALNNLLNEIELVIAPESGDVLDAERLGKKDNLYASHILMGNTQDRARSELLSVHLSTLSKFDKKGE